MLKIEHPVMFLATMAYIYMQLRIRVTIFSIDGKFRPVLNFTELQALTQVQESYHILIWRLPLSLHTQSGLTIQHYACGMLSTLYFHADMFLYRIQLQLVLSHWLELR